MGKDNRVWRKLAKKLRRSKIRVADAVSRQWGVGNNVEEQDYVIAERRKVLETGDSTCSTMSVNDPSADSDDEEILHKLQEAAWLERERQAQLEFQMKRAEEMKKEMTRAAEDQRIRSEWEETQRKAKERDDETERLENETRKKQVRKMLWSTWLQIIKEEEFDQFLSFLSGDIETPPLPYLIPEVATEECQSCLYFNRTGVCRFGGRCTRLHPKPTLSNTILVPNFFSHFSLDQNLKDDFDTDLSLEYENSDMHRDFLEFYEDVLPEFRLSGKVTQFKVCQNFEPHLSGNVYVQYETIWDSVQAYRKFNGRFYNGKQLSLQFIKIESWKGAICGQFHRNRCQKGRSCNYLHVFRNPTREFVKADNDGVEFKQTVCNNRVRSNRQSPDLYLSSRHGSQNSSSLRSDSLWLRSRSRSPRRSRSRSTRYLSHKRRRTSRSNSRKVSRSKSRSPTKSHRNRTRSRTRADSRKESLSSKTQKHKSKVAKIPDKVTGTCDPAPAREGSTLAGSTGTADANLIFKPMAASESSASFHEDSNRSRRRKHKSHKSSKNKKKKRKKHKKKGKSSKAAEEVNEDGDETLSDASAVVSTPSPRR